MRDITLLSEYIDKTVFPCSRDELIYKAEDGCAPEAIIMKLEQLPDMKFADMNSVVVSVKQMEHSGLL